MKMAIFSEDSIPIIYNALCLWCHTLQHNCNLPDLDALELIMRIENEFPELFNERKLIKPHDNQGAI